MTAPRIDSYTWSGGAEAILRFGPDDGPIVVLALPLFEEANRTRGFAVALLRALADRGIAGALPDLPATGESIVPTRDLSLFPLRAAFEAAVEHVWSARRVFALGIRSGCLLDTLPLVAGRWHLSPVLGSDLVRELGKTASLGGEDDPVEIAGNLISRAFLAELAEAVPATLDDDRRLRVVRLASDPRPADRKIDAVPLWRRQEPGEDFTLVQQLADDIAEWIARCAG
ncbi:hypothetical protein ACT009_03390 [Sphingomonas sp. Tas61C01]|uniref:hypothetical protein n=1 Tax=Sphingomonas sp. Tas61C01 TaxID=3458297 RepID=UPI00403E7A70